MLGYVKPSKSTWNHHVTTNLLYDFDACSLSLRIWAPQRLCSCHLLSPMMKHHQIYLYEFQFLDWTPSSDIFLQEFIPGVQWRKQHSIQFPGIKHWDVGDGMEYITNKTMIPSGND